MTIYLDAVWLLNLLLDMMILMLTQALVRDNTRKIRIFFGAIIASLIVPISLFYPESFFTSVIGKFLFSILIILSAFKYHSIHRMTKILSLFYFTTFSIGGGLLGIHFFLQNTFSVSNNGLLTFNSGFGAPVSWLFIVIGFPIVWIFTKMRMDKHVTEKIRYDQMYPVTIKIKRESFSTVGYIDSGNQLVDPLTKRPVIICDELFLKQWFIEEEWTSLKKAYIDLNMEDLPKRWEESIQIIPYRGVEGKSSFLFTIKPEKVIVNYNDDLIITSNVLIGIQFSTLTNDQSYHCLLHPQIIKLGTISSA